MECYGPLNQLQLRVLGLLTTLKTDGCSNIVCSSVINILNDVGLFLTTLDVDYTKEKEQDNKKFVTDDCNCLEMKLKLSIAEERMAVLNDTIYHLQTNQGKQKYLISVLQQQLSFYKQLTEKVMNKEGRQVKSNEDIIDKETLRLLHEQCNDVEVEGERKRQGSSCDKENGEKLSNPKLKHDIEVKDSRKRKVDLFEDDAEVVASSGIEDGKKPNNPTQKQLNNDRKKRQVDSNDEQVNDVKTTTTEKDMNLKTTTSKSVTPTEDTLQDIWVYVKNLEDEIVSKNSEIEKLSLDNDEYSIQFMKCLTGKQGLAALIQSIRECSVKCFELWLSLEVNIYDREDNEIGYTPVHWAVISGCQIILNYFLNTNHSVVDMKDNLGRTPLTLAAEHNRTSMIDLLIDQGADINSESNSSVTPLHSAVQYGNTEVVQLLLDQQAVVDVKDYCGSTPLHIAAREGHLEITKILLKAKAETKIKNCKDRTPLEEAEESKNKEKDEDYKAIKTLLLELKRSGNAETDDYDYLDYDRK